MAQAGFVTRPILLDMFTNSIRLDYLDPYVRSGQNRDGILSECEMSVDAICWG